MSKPTLAQTLERLMESLPVRGKKMSANELSRRSGVPQSTITRILNGDVKDPRTQQLSKIAGVFGVGVAELRGERETPTIGIVPTTEGKSIPSANEDLGQKFYQAYVTQLEMDMLTSYRSANEIGRRAIYAALTALARENPANASNNNVKKIR